MFPRIWLFRRNRKAQAEPASPAGSPVAEDSDLDAFLAWYLETEARRQRGKKLLQEPGGVHSLHLSASWRGSAPRLILAHYNIICRGRNVHPSVFGSELELQDKEFFFDASDAAFADLPALLLSPCPSSACLLALGADARFDDDFGDEFWDARSSISDGECARDPAEVCDPKSEAVGGGLMKEEALVPNLTPVSSHCSSQPETQQSAADAYFGFEVESEADFLPSEYSCSSSSTSTANSTVDSSEWSVDTQQRYLDGYGSPPFGAVPAKKPESMWSIRRLVGASAAPQAAAANTEKLNEAMLKGHDNTRASISDANEPEGANAAIEGGGATAGSAAADAPGAVVAGSSNQFEEEEDELDTVRLIPDSDVEALMRMIREQEGEMQGLPQQQQKHQVADVKGAQERGPAASDGRSAPHQKPGGSDGNGSHAKDREGWRLLMRRSTKDMQYSSWIKDKGRNGRMEFRGRMLLLPLPEGQGVQEPARPSTGERQCQEPAPRRPLTVEAVRDFLLDEVHRAEWDENREASEMLDEWDERGTSVARWVRRLPLFLRSREYVVGRRVWSPPECPRTYYCISRNTTHPAAPAQNSLVRVSAFFSSWRVRPLPAQEAQENIATSALPRQGTKQRGHRVAADLGGRAEAVGGLGEAVEIITHYEEESGLPKDLVRMGVAHGMWGVMLKMEQALRKYVLAGRNLRHVLPVTLLQAEQAALSAAREALAAPALSSPGTALETMESSPRMGEALQ